MLNLCYPFRVDQRIYGFPPLIGTRPSVLIIGSMPSVRSLERRQYYGHPRNHFWEIIFRILNKPLPVDYEDRSAELRKAGIALWDAIAVCKRQGSLDKSIGEEQYNDVSGLIMRYPTIRLVVFNGRKAEQSFLAGVRGRDTGHAANGNKVRTAEDILIKRCHFTRLPSTSPIPTRKCRTMEDKLDDWRIIAQYIDGVEK